MKVLVCLFAILAVSNASLLKLLKLVGGIEITAGFVGGKNPGYNGGYNGGYSGGYGYSSSPVSYSVAAPSVSYTHAAPVPVSYSVVSAPSVSYGVGGSYGGGYGGGYGSSEYGNGGYNGNAVGFTKFIKIVKRQW